MIDPREYPEALQPQDEEPRDLRWLAAIVGGLLLALGLKLAGRI